MSGVGIAVFITVFLVLVFPARLLYGYSSKLLLSGLTFYAMLGVELMFMIFVLVDWFMDGLIDGFMVG